MTRLHFGSIGVLAERAKFSPATMTLLHFGSVIVLAGRAN